MSDIQIFDPVKFSAQENAFLKEVLGLPPVVASARIPPGINPKAVMPMIQRVYELEQLQSHEGQRWVGVPAIQKAIDTYIDQSARWKADRRRGRIRFPSMSSYDARGQAFRGATGSDAGQIRTYFDAEGKRQPFEIELIPNETPFWTAPGIEPAKPNGIIDETENHRLVCPICKHTESYNPEKGRSSYAAARARISKHLRSTKSDVQAHYEVYTLEFRS